MRPDLQRGRTAARDARACDLNYCRSSDTTTFVTMNPRPTVRDSTEYEIDDDDLDFLQIDRDSVERWDRHESPLGVEAADYREVCRGLFEALEADGITDADVRIQGSSVRFFSSALKPMLYSRVALVSEFVNQFKRFPTAHEAARMMDRLGRHWLSPGPRDRPFDALFVIGAAAEKSDIDFQVSSEDVRRRLESAAAALGVPLSSMKELKVPYNFFRKEFTDSAFIHTNLWRIRSIELLQRPVSVAMFDAGGPPIATGPVSSHFRDDDWKVDRDE